MKNFKTASLLMLIFVVCSAFSLKGRNQVYMAGVSASFKDSLVYFTDVQLVDSVELDKNKLLPERQQYSHQLRTYLEGVTGISHRTCFVYFNTNKEKLEKDIKKLKEKYQKSGNSIIRQVNPEFKFQPATIYE